MQPLKIIIVSLAAFLSCCRGNDDSESHAMLFDRCGYPCITEHEGHYYYIMQEESGTIKLRESVELEKINKAVPKDIYDGKPDGLGNIWSPELVHIGDKWYIYFEGDDGNTDNHQIYVLESDGNDPMTGNWTLHGPVITNEEWNFGIHPSSVVVNGRQYLFWSGWKHRRSETEMQCIFIAEMENPWTLKTPRVMISSPEYEWERQWINPDGTRTAYPIFVNENPEPFLSPDGKKIIVGYSASGIWTPYNSLGILYAPTDSNLLDINSWTKLSEPQFKSAEGDSTKFGISNISVLTKGDGSSVLAYQAKRIEYGYEVSYICMKRIEWDGSSMPVFGSPR